MNICLCGKVEKHDKYIIIMIKKTKRQKYYCLEREEQIT
jgi:hypothetical protein